MGSSGVLSLFSPGGEYFAYCTPDGCLKIWDTSSDCLKQEYTPSSHLSSSCSSIAWGPISSNFVPAKKRAKKSKSKEATTDIANLNLIAMGTLSGDVLLYSVAKGDLHLCLQSGHAGVVNDVCWHVETDSIFTCSNDQHIVRWKISSGKVYEKWKADKEAIYSVCVIDKKNIISASSTIKWWDLEKKTVIKKFHGHGTEVFRLLPIISQPMESSTGQYFISAAVGDRIISAWRLKDDGDCSAVASFTLPDEPHSLSLTNIKDQPTRLSIITKSGDLHIFEHQLNGRCKTPLLPKVTFHVATSNASYEKPISVPVLAAQISTCGASCQMAYGNFLKPVFETIELQDCEKDMYLIRDVLTKCSSNLEKEVSKVKEPLKDGVIKHLAPGFMTPSHPNETSRKRKRRLSQGKEFSMEERLNALFLDKASEEVQETTKADSVVHLLLQGLQSQDHKLLDTALQCSDEVIIRNSVQRLPLPSIPLLLKELHKRLSKKEERNDPCLRWMKSLIRVHFSYLMTCPDIDEYLGPVSQLLEARVKTLPNLIEVGSKLKVLLSEAAPYEPQNRNSPHSEALVTYREDSSSEDEMSASEAEENIEIESEKDESEAENVSTSDSDNSDD